MQKLVETVTIDKIEYYNTEDILNNAPIYTKGRRSGRDLIKNKNIEAEHYVYARKQEDYWITASGKSIKYDKVFIKKDYVDTIKDLCIELGIVEEEVDEEEHDDKIKIAPEIIILKDEEKFKDIDGNCLEIETRGERTCKNIFFKVNDVEKKFGIKKLRTVLLDKTTKCKEKIHYKYFYCKDTMTHGSITDKKKIRKDLFLTFKGLTQVLHSWRSPNAEKYIDWVNETVFTIQFGSKMEKKKLSANIMGVPVEAVIEVFNTYAKDMPCIYGFTLGNVKEVREAMKLGPEYKDDDVVFKYGRTGELMVRIKKHKKTYGDIKGCDLKLKYHVYVDTQYCSKAELDIKNYFTNIDCFIKYEKQEELVIITQRELIGLKEIYSKIMTDYSGHLSTFISKIKKVENKNNVLKTEMENIKKFSEQEILNIKTIHMKDEEIYKKNLDMLTKDIDNIMLHKKKDEEYFNRDIVHLNKDIEYLKRDFEMEIKKMRETLILKDAEIEGLKKLNNI